MKQHQGQILPGSEFGKLLTRLAQEAETIVEIGCWFGNGSTLCLHQGMTRQTQKMVTFEVDLIKLNYARLVLNNDPRVTFVHGTIVRLDEYQPLVPGSIGEEFYGGEKTACFNAPYRFDAIPEQIDLLLLDGGDWCSEVEFGKLMDRSRVIALDDTDPSRAVKNVRNREFILSNPNLFKIMVDNLKDRNGWMVAQGIA